MFFIDNARNDNAALLLLLLQNINEQKQNQTNHADSCAHAVVDNNVVNDVKLLVAARSMIYYCRNKTKTEAKTKPQHADKASQTCCVVHTMKYNV